MNTRRPATDLALDILSRSTYKISKLGAVIYDNFGIISWGWNHWYLNDGNYDTPPTIHAEVHAITRANRKRMRGSIMVIACKMRSEKNVHLAMPCEKCMKRIIKVGIKKIIFTNPRSPTLWSTIELYK